MRTTERRTTRRRLDPIAIECVTPELDAGRFPVKRIVGDVVRIGADIFKEGHDALSARIAYKGPGEPAWLHVPMRYEYDPDRWFGEIVVDRIGRWTFSVEAWTDTFGDWRAKLRKKVDADQDVGVDLLIGAQIIRRAARVAKGATRASLTQTAKVLEDRREFSIENKIRRALDDELLTLIGEFARPNDLTRYGRDLTIVVDRERARFGAWYEMFPRSQRADGEHGTFADAAARLPRLAELGYDVVYLPPIHPIGRSFRKGKNNALSAEPDDVGSPWAIGNEHGGHDAIEPALGTIDDFDDFVETARRHDLEIALDYALQCSPDHPWVKEHPDWFTMRPDGTIAYAENPPKKYQDIYPLDFWCADRQNLWNACRDVLEHWISHGVTIFRVDNPHTKAFAFWEWVIGDVQSRHPETIFFAEAFTRPKKMKHLAKLGFTMSYTYFTWKNSPGELKDYARELTQSPMVEYYRGNFFANTPDILHEYLVDGGRPAFRIRLLLAATLLPSYGLYSGFELYENTPVRRGSEEYLDSEKYQIKPRNWDAPGSLDCEIQRINQIRRQHRALQLYDNLRFLPSDNDRIIWYWKRHEPSTVDRRPSTEHVFIAVTTDPHAPQETMVTMPLSELGIAPDDEYIVRDLLTDDVYTWRGARNYIRLDPSSGSAGHIFVVEPEQSLPASR